MTIEKLLQLPAKDLEKLTDEELLTYFKPYLVITRPDPQKIKQRKIAKDEKKGMQDLFNLAKKMGI